MRIQVKARVDPALVSLPPEQQQLRELTTYNQSITHSDTAGKPLLLLLWHQEHSARVLLDLRQDDTTELTFPSSLRHIVKGEEDQTTGLGVQLVVRTLNDEGVLARRRIGTAIVPWSDLMQRGAEKQYQLHPLVNSLEVHSAVQGTVLVRVIEPAVPQYRGRPRLQVARELVGSFVQRETRSFEAHRFISDEAAQIRSEMWRTPEGFCPSVYYLWGLRARNEPSDPAFYHSALRLGCNRLGIRDEEFMRMSDAEAAEVVGTAINAVVTMSPYLSDEARVRKRNYVETVAVEQFASAAAVNTQDCEDGSCESAATLWLALQLQNWNAPPSKLVSRAASVAGRYRVFGLLSSVTGPSVASVANRGDIDTSVFSARYLEQAYTGHFFVAAIPREACERMRTGKRTAASQWMPTIVSEPTGFTASTPLPISAYPKMPRSRAQFTDQDAIRQLGEWMQPRLGPHGVLAGFHPQGHDDVISPVKFASDADANVTQFYRWVVCGYEIQPAPGDAPPRAWQFGMGVEGNEFVSGLNYRHLVAQDERARMTPLAAPEPQVTEAALRFYDSQFPQLLPSPPTSGVPYRVLHETGIRAQPQHPTVVRYYRAGFASGARVSVLREFMHQVPPEIAKGSRLVQEYGGSFPSSQGNWTGMDDQYQSLRLEFYL